MKVRELIAVLEQLPADYEAFVSSGEIAAVWVSDASQRIDIDYGNSWYSEGQDGHHPDDDSGTFRKAFDAFPDQIVTG